MAELRRSQGIPVFEGYDPEALVKVKNLIELEEINTAIGEESAALRVNNRTLTRYNEQLKLDNKNMRQYFVSQHEADTAAKDKEIEKQKDAKKKAKEKLRAERKNNEIFVAQNFKGMHDDHLQNFYQMLTTELKSRGTICIIVYPGFFLF